MNSTEPTLHAKQLADRWLGAMSIEAYAAARRKEVAATVADDIVQEMAIYALGQLDELMAKYPNPAVFANVRFAHGHSTWRRTQSVQRCEGARRTRRVVSLDTPVSNGEGEQVCTLADTLSTADTTSERAQALLEAAGLRSVVDNCLDRRRADAFVAVRVWGQPVAEYAQSEGVARETVSRWINAAARDLVGQLEPLAR